MLSNGLPSLTLGGGLMMERVCTLESKPVGNRGCLLNSSHKLNCVWVGTTALRLERKKFQNCLDNKYFFSII